MSAFNITRAAMESAPKREKWDAESVYEGLFLLPSRKKHDSGYHLICIVGANVKPEGGVVLEQAAWCDDICWHIPQPTDGQHFAMRTDMTYPGGIAHVWGWRTQFRVGASLSSTDVTVEAKASAAIAATGQKGE